MTPTTPMKTPMKTVLFIDGSALYEAYRRMIRLFEEFEESGQIVVCRWDSHAFSPRAIRAELERVVAEDEQWRALIVSDLSHENLHDYAYDLLDAVRTRE